MTYVVWLSTKAGQWGTAAGQAEPWAPDAEAGVPGEGQGQLLQGGGTEQSGQVSADGAKTQALCPMTLFVTLWTVHSGL